MERVHAWGISLGYGNGDMFLSNTIPHRMFADILLFELCCRNCVEVTQYNVMQPRGSIADVDFACLDTRRAAMRFPIVPFESPMRRFFGTDNCVSLSRNAKCTLFLFLSANATFFFLFIFFLKTTTRITIRICEMRHIYESNVLQLITRFHIAAKWVTRYTVNLQKLHPGMRCAAAVHGGNA